MSCSHDRRRPRCTQSTQPPNREEVITRGPEEVFTRSALRSE
jgi:hypothetical protein